MIKRYAIIKNNKIQNICLWDGVTLWEPEEGSTVIESSDAWRIDGTFVDGVYHDPVPQPTLPNVP
jgi:hypothetical protein